MAVQYGITGQLCIEARRLQECGCGGSRIVKKELMNEKARQRRKTLRDYMSFNLICNNCGGAAGQMKA